MWWIRLDMHQIPGSWSETTRFERLCHAEGVCSDADHYTF